MLAHALQRCNCALLAPEGPLGLLRGAVGGLARALSATALRSPALPPSAAPGAPIPVVPSEHQLQQQRQQLPYFAANGDTQLALPTPPPFARWLFTSRWLGHTADGGTSDGDGGGAGARGSRRQQRRWDGEHDGGGRGDRRPDRRRHRRDDRGDVVVPWDARIAGGGSAASSSSSRSRSSSNPGPRSSSSRGGAWGRPPREDFLPSVAKCPPNWARTLCAPFQDARTWHDLHAALASTSHLHGAEAAAIAAAATHAYASILAATASGARGIGATQDASAAAADGAAPAAAQAAASGVGGGGGAAAAPVAATPEVTSLLQELLLKAAPYAYPMQRVRTIYNLSRAPRDPLARGPALGALLTPLELFPLHRWHRDDTSAASVADATKEASQLFTALRRLHVAEPAVYGRLAEAALPLLAAPTFAGDPLAGVLLALSQAASGVGAAFLERGLTVAVQPESLRRLSTPYYAVALLAAAARDGVSEPTVLAPIADRLVELIREARARPQQGEQQGEQQGGPQQQRASGPAPAAPGAPVLRVHEVITALQSFAALEYASHTECLHALAEESLKGRATWSMYHRLQVATRFLELDIDLLGAAPPPQPASDGALPPAMQGQQQEQRDQAQQQQHAAHAGRPEPLVTEAEVVAYLRRPELGVADLLANLPSLVRLRQRPSGSAPSAAAPGAAPGAGAPFCMPNALALAVELAGAGAPLMNVKGVCVALTSLHAASAPPPPALLQRAQDLHLGQMEAAASAGQQEQGGAAAVGSAARPAGAAAGAGGEALGDANELHALRVAVGRAVACAPPGVVEAAQLQEGFLRSCRAAASFA